MCGLWGRALFNKNVSIEDLLHPIRALSHRGPDDYGWFLKDQVGLVHTRLSIIDLASGAQPLRSGDKRMWGIINGELYDYKSLRQTLVQKGVQFKTQGDSEVLLNLFAYEGIHALKNISGEFAFIFFDEEKNCVHFGRDAHGVKPLFYQLNDEGITLASEMKALDDKPVEISEEYLKRFIGRMIVPPLTFLKDVYHVLPGRIYTLDLETKKLVWDSFQALPFFSERNLSREESLLQLEATLLEAVEKRLVADVEIGCYLSGGIDSTLVAAMAVKLGAKPKAFTVGFADKDLDETGRASVVAKHLGIEHSIVAMNGKNFFSSLKKSIVAFENPVTNPHGAAKNLLSEHAAESVKVILSGEGADEWLGGYSYFRLKKLRDFLATHKYFSPDLLNQYVRKEMAINMNSLDGKSMVNDHIVKPQFNGQSVAVFARAMKHPMFHYLTNDKLTPFVDGAASSLRSYFEEEYPEKIGEASNWDLNSWASLRTDLLHYILSNVGDRQEMSNSLEGRTPFMDTQLTEVMARIPEKYLLNGMTEKWVLREIARKYLPQEIWNFKKHPFFAPMKYLYIREAREGMGEYIDIAREHTPWLNWQNIERVLSEEKLGSQSMHVDTIISMKLILFSTGVLVKELKQINHTEVRGYKLPHDVHDIINYRKRA